MSSRPDVNLLELGASPLSDHDFSSLQDFSKFRRYPGFSGDELKRIFSGMRVECSGPGACGLINAYGNVVSSMCTITPSPWETGYFGLPMGKLNCFHAAGVSAHDLGKIVSGAVDMAISKGMMHFSAEVDIDDYATVNALVKNGFEFMDIKRSYFTNRLHENKAYRKFEGFVRDYAPSDHNAVMKILSEVKYETRFTRDPFLDPAKSAALYGRWFCNLVEALGRGAKALVFEREGRIAACAGIGELDFSKYGVARKVPAGSLYAAARDGVGGYAPVIYRLTRESLASHGFMEATISLNNLPAVRVVEGIRPTKSVTFISLRLYCGS